jgi:hypothetical protein
MPVFSPSPTLPLATIFLQVLYPGSSPRPPSLCCTPQDGITPRFFDCLFRGIFDSGSSSTELLCAKTVPTASAGTVNSAGCIRYLFRTPLRYPPSQIVLWCSFFVARDIRGPTSSYLHVHSLSAVQSNSISIIQNASVRLPRGALAHFLNVSFF